jgi:hypothetical protein
MKRIKEETLEFFLSSTRQLTNVAEDGTIFLTGNTHFHYRTENEPASVA